MEATVSSAAEVIGQGEAIPTATATCTVRDGLDDLPVTIIERKPGWRFLDLGELWRYRELLFFLAWRDVKVRYKQTVLGAAWAVLQPFATMVVFSLFFGRMGDAPDGGHGSGCELLNGKKTWHPFDKVDYLT